MSQQHRCVIKGCKKGGSYRLIHSDDEYYGWFCRGHQNELFNKNYIYLEGEGYNITIPNERYGHTICLACGHGEPCGICEYIKNNKSQKWIYEQTLQFDKDSHISHWKV